MNCIKCGHVVEPAAPRTMETELRGERVSVTLEAPQCPNCGRVVMLGKNTRTYYRAVSDAYRSKVGLLTTSELDNLRRGLNMKWPDFARYVFVGIATLKRWRRGEIQTQALDRLVRLRADPEYLLETASELREHLAAANSSVLSVDEAVGRLRMSTMDVRLIRRRRRRAALGRRHVADSAKDGVTSGVPNASRSLMLRDVPSFMGLAA